MSFQDKVVIVTGASSGIGAATAIAFSAAGAKVAIVARNQTKLAKVAEICSQKGNKPLVLAADVTKEAEKIITDTVKHFGGLDVLVNNAGIFRVTSILDPDSLDGYDSVMDTNLRSTVRLTHFAAPHLIKTKGNVVNVSSVAGIGVAAENAFAYHASKAGMDHFMRAVALELSQYGVRVNSVNPGPVKTDILENSGFPKQNEEALLENMVKTVPLRRIGESEEIADLILFVASHAGRSITGSTFVSDNGVLLKGIPS